MTYGDAIEFLYGLRLFGAKFGLENTLRLAAQAGNPHRSLRFIHVAGTNGKGSTCAMLESIYRHGGLRVGLFTSPHLVSFRERIQVNRQPVPEADVVRLVAELQPLLARFPRDQHPTFFEVITVMALRYFAEQRCELVIWETGLGGRLDATNIVTPLASVITNIGFDHQQWLGTTLAAIAAEKAGIIKTGVPVHTAAADAEALAVIHSHAVRLNAVVHVLSEANLGRCLPEHWIVPLAGAHQRINAALAVAVVKSLGTIIPIPAETTRRGVESVHWPGRLQTLTARSGQKLLLDGAHNTPGCEALARAICDLSADTRPALVLGMLEDKDSGTMCAQLAPLSQRIGLVRVASARTAAPDALAAHCRLANSTAEVKCFDSVRQALLWLEAEPLVVVTGSLYLVGEVLALLNPDGTSADERGLNEWR